MEQTTVKAEVRAQTGSAEARRLRRAGRVPGVVYGHKQGAVSVLLAKEQAQNIVAHRVKMVQLDLGGQSEPVLVKDVQFDTFGEKVLHVDFERIAMDEMIEVECPVELVGTAKGAAAGGIVEHPVTDLEVRCLPADIPESIRVSVSDLEIGGVIHVRDIKVPAGVTVLTDPESILVTVRAPIAVEEAAPAAEAAPGAEEPELIRRERAEEEEEEEKGKEKK